MRPRTLVPFAVAMLLLAPVEKANAGTHKLTSTPLDAVHFNPNNGRLLVGNASRLTTQQREKAAALLADGIYAIAQDCLESGVIGDTTVGERRNSFTFQCGQDSVVTSCTFEENDLGGSPTYYYRETSLTCVYPSRREVYMRRLERGLGENCSHDKTTCDSFVTTVDVTFRGSNFYWLHPAAPKKGKLTHSSIIEESGALVDVTNGPDSFSTDKRDGFEVIHSVFEVGMNKIRALFKAAVRNRKPGKVPKGSEKERGHGALT